MSTVVIRIEGQDKLSPVLKELAGAHESLARAARSSGEAGPEAVLPLAA